MGLTKQYLRYIPGGNFNIIASPNCNVSFVTLEGHEGRFVAVGASEHVIIWDMRLGEKSQVLPGDKSPSSYLCASPNKRNLSVGYLDGNIQIYDLKTAEIVTIFSGHKSEITCLAYDNFGHKLASGSKDTDIIVWDTVAEVGMCRLIGHKGVITQLSFMLEKSVLISSSKDTFVKCWDYKTEHCFKTIVGHQSEVWSLCLMNDDQYLVTGCGDGELRVWNITERNSDNNDDELQMNQHIDKLATNLQLTSMEDIDEMNYGLQCIKAGSLLRSGKGRVLSMFSDVTGQILGCHGSDAQLELFNFCTESEARVRLKKRLAKERKKNPELHMETNAADDTVELSLRDEVRRLTAIKLKSKPKSFDLVLGNGGELRVAIVLNNNTVELYTMQRKKEGDVRCLSTISMQGHQGEVRALSFSSDNLAIVSGSRDSVKIWNRPSQICLRTVQTGYVLCTIFVPGDRHVLCGLMDGKLLILDIAAGDVLEEVPAHNAELWSICLQPDLRGVVTGGGDKTVKFWQFELIHDEESNSKAKVLSLVHTRTLKLDDCVLCVKISPNGKFIAAALLDSTVKIFFVDSFKFYLSLYGHKLPVLCMDISSDSTLIATGSADRNVKLWGLDFGDCHKSIFAHDDSITALQFVPKTHYFFTCGKEGKVKQWDGDSYNKIITLQGHSGEAFNLSVSPNGQFVVSCGSDRVLRLYEKTDQTLVLQDEEEEEREQQEGLATGEQTVIPGQGSLNLPSRKTIGSEKSAESIMECLEVSGSYKELLLEHSLQQAKMTQTLPQPPLPLIMQAFNVTKIDDFIIETLGRIRSSDLEETLLILPFSAVCDLLQYLSNLSPTGHCIELISRVVIFLMKIHHAPILSNYALLPTLKNLQKYLSVRIEALRDVIGYNYYSMLDLQEQIEASQGVQLFKDATLERKKGEKKRKQREKRKRSIITLTT